MIVQKTPVEKQVQIAATVSEVDGIKLKNRDGIGQRLPPAKYLGSVYKMLSPKQKEWLWQDCKKAKVNGGNIPAATRNDESLPSSRPSA